MSLDDKGIVTFRGGLGGKKLFRFEAKDVKVFIKIVEAIIMNRGISRREKIDRLHEEAGERLI